MATNLWTDVDALARLARSGRAAERTSRAGAALAPLPPAGVLPVLPRRPEIALHTVSAPARVVTGDYADCFFVSQHELAVVMADVSGKGTPAAVLMAVARSVVRNVAADGASPGETLTRVDRILYDARLGAMYLTIFLGLYDVRTGALRYANAAHPCPLLARPGGEPAEFGEVTGPILGILDVGPYAEARGRIEVGERLVLYTDGVTEAQAPDGAFFGRRRLKDLLKRHAAAPVDELLQHVAGDLDAFQAGRRHDDATLLALQRRA